MAGEAKRPTAARKVCAAVGRYAGRYYASDAALRKDEKAMPAFRA